MAWIESHQKLRDDPKLIDLMVVSNRGKAECIGLLHLLWWWCVDHAEDGDLRKFNDGHISIAVGLPVGEGQVFVESLKKSGFVECVPYFRIANWWKFSQRYLKRKYEDKPEKWQQIQALYGEGATGRLPDGKRSGNPYGYRINQTNQTNQTNIKEIYVEKFEDFWKNYPPRNGKKIEREETFKRFCQLPEDDLPKIINAAKNYATSELVKKGIGIKDPKRFIKNKDGEFWREWIEPETKPELKTQTGGENGKIRSAGGNTYTGLDAKDYESGAFNNL